MLPYEFKNRFFYFCEECHGDFDWYYIHSANSFFPRMVIFIILILLMSMGGLSVI